MNHNKIVIAAFYHFANLENYVEMQKPLIEFCKERGLMGTILLAREGINSTISGSRTAIDELIAHLRSDPRMHDLSHKESFAEEYPFKKIKVRLKKEIVRMDVEDLDLDKRGTYVEPKDWDELISRDDVILVDTRNNYEVQIGTFEGAINPKTNYFREFTDWVKKNLDPTKHKKVAMCCTGGIRCEKSTSLLKNMGYEDVYHLKGGILQYLEDTKNQNHKWVGDCFVFDDRIAVDETLTPSTKYTLTPRLQKFED